MNKEKGAFICRYNDSTILIIYKKAGTEVLKKALPLSYNEKEMSDHGYIIGHYAFVEGGICPGEGSGTYTDLLEIVQTGKMVDIMANEYPVIKEKCRDLSLDDYNRGLTFARSQLVTI